MVEGQGWEGMYFLDLKLQFLYKNKKNLSTKVENLAKPSQRNVLVWKDGNAPTSKTSFRKDSRKCKLTKPVSDKK